MPKQDTRTGQIILETVIVMISIATIVLYSIARFSHFNGNLVDRMNMYRESRRHAMNNPYSASFVPMGQKHRDSLDPQAYLDFPFEGMINLPGLQLPGDYSGYGDEFNAEDARMSKIEVLQNDFDAIMNIILPAKLQQAYGLLGGDGCDDEGCILSITRAQATQARDLINELLLNENNYNRYGRSVSDPFDDVYSAYRGYQDFFENMDGRNSGAPGDPDSDIDRNGNGVIDAEDANRNGLLDSGEDTNGNGKLDDESEFMGGIGWLQRILDVPVENGPFDQDMGCRTCAEDDQACLRERQACLSRQDGNIRNRASLQNAINSMLSTKSGIDILYFGNGPEPGLMARLTRVRNYLNSALSVWDDQSWEGEWLRIAYLRNARAELKDLIDIVGTVLSGITDTTPDYDLATLIEDTVNFLQPPPDWTNVGLARSNCNAMLSDPQIIGNPPNDPNGDPPFQPALHSMIRNVFDVLNDLFRNWDPDRAISDTAYCRQRLQILYEIVTGAY